ncbi:MAG: hypothetical protein A2338_04055 [Bacteroidetes bacterium RIFOXYB12_FULL_41_6]|nr:MAG: hypothetical protein A2338_04055 [Bacteroidetes bacterium RIFOXYB12_FULL_41_6]
MNEYYKKRPIRNGDYARDYLSENFQLSSENLHLILLEIDSKYRFENDKTEMLRFLRKEDFTESIDKVGNFQKDCTIFYRKNSTNEYLIFNQQISAVKSNQTIFNFWKLTAIAENKFLTKRTNDAISIKFGFSPKEDIELYKIENKKNVW